MSGVVKVTLNNDTLIDISDSTIESDKVLSSYIGYEGDGDRIVGTYSEETEAELKDVNFYDYDGTRVYSYTYSEWANVTELPSLLAHDGLIAERWAQWTKSEIDTQISDVGGIVNVYPNYITDDGKTRIYLEINDDVSPYFGICPNGTVEIDWGDGSPVNTVTGTSTSTNINTQHSYSKGTYVMKITPSSNAKYGFSGNNNASYLISKSGTPQANSDRYYEFFIKKIELGTDVYINNHAFDKLAGMEKISVPKSVNVSSATSVFNECVRLKCAPISWGAGYYMGNTLYTHGFAAFGNNISANILNGARLTDLCIKKGATGFNNNAFTNNYLLRKLYIPSTVATIGTNVFAGNYNTIEYHFRSTTPPSLADTNAFANIPTNCKIYVPYSADHSILNAYKTATNWLTYASYMVEESQ